LALLVLLAVIFPLGREEPRVHGAAARSLAVSADGKRLLVGLLNGKLRLLDYESGRQLSRTTLNAEITAVSFGPADTVLALTVPDDKLRVLDWGLKSKASREVHPNPRDLLWSGALEAAIVLAGGQDGLHAKLEIFPAQPLGIATSTSRLVELKTWSRPRHLAISRDAARIAITYESRKANLLLYNLIDARVAATHTLPDAPQGVAFSADGERLFLALPGTEELEEITPASIRYTAFPKQASTSPPRMIAVNDAARRAYTTGSLTFPEIDLDQNRISRTVELPDRSAALALAPDGATAYLTLETRDTLEVIDLRSMKRSREIDLR